MDLQPSDGMCVGLRGPQSAHAAGRYRRNGGRTRTNQRRADDRSLQAARRCLRVVPEDAARCGGGGRHRDCRASSGVPARARVARTAPNTLEPLSCSPPRATPPTHYQRPSWTAFDLRGIGQRGPFVSLPCRGIGELRAFVRLLRVDMGEPCALVDLLRAGMGELQLGQAEPHGFVGELVVIVTELRGFIVELCMFMGDIVAIVLDEAAWLGHPQGLIADEHMLIGTPDGKLGEPEALMAHEGWELTLSRGELAHDYAGLGYERAWQRDETQELGHAGLRLDDARRP